MARKIPRKETSRKEKPNVYRPGTESHAREEINRLRRRANAAIGRSKRTKNPEVRRRELRTAGTERRKILQLESDAPQRAEQKEKRDLERQDRTAYRSSLSKGERKKFDSMSRRGQDRRMMIHRQFPRGIPPDIPDPTAGLSRRDRRFNYELDYSKRRRSTR